MSSRVAAVHGLYTLLIERLRTSPLGNSGIDVSVLALGSWRTYERISREQGLSVMLKARECGVTFLDDARYNDETGSSPMATGYSEVVFGELFRAAGWKRDETVVANKLWWEFWPEQSASKELEGSLRRMGFDYLDLVYSFSAPGGPPIAEIVAAVGELISSGKTRAWGTANWEPADHAQAAAIAAELDVPPPCAAQLPYNLAHRESVESQPAADALDRSGAGVVASFVLAGGVLSGKYDDPATPGRMRELLDDPDLVDERAASERRELELSLRVVPALRALAAEMDTTPAALAIAFALSGERVSSVLFGATTPAQVAENIAATDLLARSSGAQLDRLRALTA
jgi:aryl-alcohol dehydrogenase-like predicted oxidoreductase